MITQIEVVVQAVKLHANFRNVTRNSTRCITLRSSFISWEYFVSSKHKPTLSRVITEIVLPKEVLTKSICSVF